MTKKIVAAALALAALCSPALAQQSGSSDQDMLFEHFFLTALQYKYSGDLNKSFEMLATCRKLQPGNAAVAYEMSRLMSGSKHNDYAADFATQAVALDSTANETYLRNAISANLRANRAAVAIDCYDRLIDADPDDPERYLDKYQLLMSIQKFDLAEIALKQVPQTNEAVRLETQLQLSSLYDTTGRRRKSLKILRALLKQNPANPRVNMALSASYAGADDIDRALQYCQAACASPMGDNYLPALALLYKQQQMDSLYAQTLRRYYASDDVAVEAKIGRLYEQMGDGQPLAKQPAWRPFYESIIAIVTRKYPSTPEMWNLADMYFTNLGEDQTGVAYLVRFADSNPSADDTMWRRIIFGSRNLSDAQALQYCRRAMKDVPDSPLFFVVGSQYMVMSGEPAEALEAARTGFEMLADADRQNAQVAELRSMAMHSMASAYIDLDSAQMAFAFFDQILAENPQDRIALNNYAYNLALKGLRLDDAERMSQTSLADEPLNATYLDTYAYVLFRRKRYTEALFVMERCIENSTNASAEEFDHYGDILFFNSRPQDAVAQWKKALDADPANALIKKKVDGQTYFEK